MSGTKITQLVVQKESRGSIPSSDHASLDSRVWDMRRTLTLSPVERHVKWTFAG